MISLDDCIALCGLTREEIDAIAEHEHIPEAAAAVLAAYLMETDAGPRTVRRMIRDDIREALAHGNREHAAELVGVLRHFMAEHPGAR